MRLGLSSAAAPEASLAQLVEVCERRGLRALELVDGHGHGIAARNAVLPDCDGLANGAVEISAYRVGADTDPRLLADLSHHLGAAIVLARSDRPEDHVAHAHSIVELGGRASILVSGADAASGAERLAAIDVQLCWEVNPAAVPVSAESMRALLRQKENLHSVRLLGGGPESSMHEGRGVDTLLRELAMAAWQGTLILAPGSTRYRVAWENWLGRRGGWGCGSAGETKRTMPLAIVQNAGGLE